MTGALLFGATYQQVYPALSALWNIGSTILPALLNVDLWLSILFFVLVTLTLFYFLERHGALRQPRG